MQSPKNYNTILMCSQLWKQFELLDCLNEFNLLGKVHDELTNSRLVIEFDQLS